MKPLAACMFGLGFVLAGCHASSRPSSHCLEGTLGVRGVDPGTELWIAGEDGDFHIEGDLEPRLRRLSGLAVGACGVLSDDSLDPSSFRLLDVQGYPARLGVLERRDGGWALRTDGEVLGLAGVSPALARHVGSEVWVAGELGDERLTVVVFGAIT